MTDAEIAVELSKLSGWSLQDGRLPPRRPAAYAAKPVTTRRRRLLFAALYFSEGAPIGFVWWALPTLLRRRGVDVADITALTSLLVLPWAFKFLWAPLVDALRTPRWTLKSFILVSQLLMAGALVPLILVDWESSVQLVYGALLLHALAAATQDVAVDAWCIQSVPATERGRINGWMQVGMLAARGLFGGGFLLLSARLGTTPVLGLLIVAILASLLLLWFTPVEAAPTEQRSLRDVAQALRSALSRRESWLALAFAAVGGAAYEGIGAVAGPFLHDQGLSKDGVGWFFVLPTVAAMAAGALLGGWLADRGGARRVAALALLGLVALAIAIAAAERAQVQADAWYALFALFYLGVGVFTAASYAWFMQVAEGRAAATLFSALMGMTNLCEAWSGRVVGVLHEPGSYGVGFALLAAVSLASLLLLLLARSRATG
jgi:MFS transporter (putative signal transducer)